MENQKSAMLGLRTVLYKVPNLDERKKWYALAFGIGPYFDEPFYVGGELMTGSVKDPWGNIIGLIYNPEFKLPE